MTRTLSIALLVLLAGCSRSATSTHTHADHPANPDAPTAPASPAPVAPAAPAHDHSMHDHAAAPAANAGMYQCPMHPEVRSDDPNALCPKCGMKINKKVSAENPR